MRVSILILPLLGIAFAGCMTTVAPKDIILGRAVILGSLGRPIGQVVTLHGYKLRNGPYTNRFRVETVDGKQPVHSAGCVNVRGIADWPEKTVATIRGYEEGVIRFVRIGDTNYFDESQFKPYQKIVLDFKITKILEPAGLRLREER